MADTDILESVEQFVNDENKIVSYEFLSQTCGIHVNLAKNVLEQFVERIKCRKGCSISEFDVVYSVGGFVGKNLSFLLVTEATLEEAKSKFDKVLYSHVYSVQKGKLLSFSLLYESNKTELKQSVEQCTGHSSIFCPAAKLRTAEELSVSKPKPESVVSKKNSDAVPLKPKPEPLKEANEINSQQQSIHPTDASVGKKAHVTTNKAPAIATFFAKHHVKDPENKKKIEEAKKNEEESKKQNIKSNKRVVREPSDDDEEMVIEAVDQKKITNGPHKRFKLAEVENPVKAAEKKSNKTKSSKIKKGKKESPSNKPQRKRIQQFSDSDSSDGGDDEMVSSPEMAIQPAPELEEEENQDILEATIVEETKTQKNKGRKLVSKTVMDDDGFVVTTKEFVPCDTEEEEVPAPVVKEVKKDVPSVKTETAPVSAKVTKRPSPPAKGKQQSITSFFVRK